MPNKFFISIYIDINNEYCLPFFIFTTQKVILNSTSVDTSSKKIFLLNLFHFSVNIENKYVLFYISVNYFSKHRH